MQIIDGRFIYSASDLNNYLECAHLTTLDRRAALREIAIPEKDEYAELLSRKGEQHEKHYLEIQRQADGDGLVDLTSDVSQTVESLHEAEARTIEAMASGAKMIYQATFFDGTFRGHADFLQRVDRPCAHWPWSYEAVDTKLALHVKPYYIIQLCNYSEHLTRVQGAAPEKMHIVLGNGELKSFRLDDYDAYYRHIKASFLAGAERHGALQTYPVEIKHCGICRWSDVCERQRADDDHLTLVANVRNDQIAKLNATGIINVKHLAVAMDEQRPPGMSHNTFATLRRQARLQVQGRTQDKPLYELLEHEAWEGFGLLPATSPGDLFFDMEGDPLYEPGKGLEYLFGLFTDNATYTSFWALTRKEEKTAFQQCVDSIVARRKQFPDMHVYHYAQYEKTALRRLAQTYGTREAEVDDLLRGEVLVDLYAVVRQSLVISESGYGIKKLERFYGLERGTDVRKGDDSIVMFETWLAESDEAKKRAILDDIRDYNEDDCRSTLQLRGWLLERRQEAIVKFGADIPFKALKVPEAPCHPEPIEGCKKCADREREKREEEQTSDLQRKLLTGLEALGPDSEDEYERLTNDDRTRYQLGNALSYHRREEKPAWWKLFDRCENQDQLFEFDKDAIACLELSTKPEHAPKKQGKDRNYTYTYTFPEQHHKMGAGDNVFDPVSEKTGTIADLDDDIKTLQLKIGLSLEDAEKVKALIPGGPPNTKEQRGSLRRIAESYAAGTLADRHPAILDLLYRRPRVKNSVTLSLSKGAPSIQPDVVDEKSISAVVRALDNSYLFIQGPPGTGKTWKGAHVICDLLAAGKRVAVMSNSHKAIHNLLHYVEETAWKHGVPLTGLYKHSDSNEGSVYQSKIATPLIRSTGSNADLEAGGYNLAGGTSWLFAREALINTFDYLFIDEAGQISLADAIAASACARNIVLLGDPLQLAQVSQGIHPYGVGASVLEHLLAEHPTIPEDCGIFLDISRRMHPEICSFISKAVYEERLHAMPGTERQRINSAGLNGSGLRYIPLQHSGNSRESHEEAERIRDEILLLLGGTVTDEDGKTHPIESKNIIVVTPYNAQRRLILSRLRDAGINDIGVGTVDKFQGQEAAVVFYSMATSSGADIPRTVDFLFEKNRFNVAISRAKALSVLVASDKLADVRCSTPEQMSTVNLLCRYIEAAAFCHPQ